MKLLFTIQVLSNTLSEWRLNIAKNKYMFRLPFSGTEKKLETKYPILQEYGICCIRGKG